LTPPKPDPIALFIVSGLLGGMEQLARSTMSERERRMADLGRALSSLQRELDNCSIDERRQVFDALERILAVYKRDGRRRTLVEVKR
jgi:hypothetical protein